MKFVTTATPSYDVGVIVGRFQTNDLTEAHRDLIDHVCDQHAKVIIFLGNSPLWATKNNPLDFQARSQMIREAYPNVMVAYVHDVGSDAKWSKKLDSQITSLVSPAQSVVLYGSRDSFLPHYEGRFDTRELEATKFVSGTAERKAIATGNTKATADFRAGVIWATQARYPTMFVAIDVAIFDETGQKVLMGRKPDETQFRFIGGFLDPGKDQSIEDAVRREGREETGLELGDPRYIGSNRQDDWRYRREQDKIMSAFFTAKRVYGRPTPGDDIEEVRWFDLVELEDKTQFVETHWPLIDLLLGARS